MFYLIQLVLLSNATTKIHVVKELRAESGVSLREASDMIDAGIVARQEELPAAIRLFNNAALNAGFKQDGYRIQVTAGYQKVRQPYEMPVKPSHTW